MRSGSRRSTAQRSTRSLRTVSRAAINGTLTPKLPVCRAQTPHLTPHDRRAESGSKRHRRAQLGLWAASQHRSPEPGCPLASVGLCDAAAAGQASLILLAEATAPVSSAQASSTAALARVTASASELTGGPLLVN